MECATCQTCWQPMWRAAALRESNDLGKALAGADVRAAEVDAAAASDTVGPLGLLQQQPNSRTIETVSASRGSEGFRPVDIGDRQRNLSDASEIEPHVASCTYRDGVPERCLPRNALTRIVASFHAVSLPPVVAPCPVGELMLSRSAT